MKTKSLKKPTLNQAFAFIVIFTGVIGLFASIYLTVEKILVLKDPSHIPACNINPLFSCGSVMNTPQAEIWGIPNTLLGVIGFAMVIAVGAAMLAGAKMHRRFWQIFNLGLLFGVFGVAWLFYQSVYAIDVLCIYCMSVWVVTIALFWYVTLWNLEQKYIILPKKLRSAASFGRKYHGEILVLTYLILAVLIVQHFWYYFKTL